MTSIGEAHAGPQGASPSGSQQEYAPLIPEELDGLEAPIALYPGALVAQILGAATFPDQVTDAEGWLRQNSKVTGESLMKAVDQQKWDPAVKVMTGGYVILAYPAEYLNSGVMSFLITQDGVIFQKDLGERTSDVAEGLTAFNLGDGWTAVDRFGGGP